MFGRQPIIHRYHRAVSMFGKVGANFVIAVDIAGYPTAAVKKNQQRKFAHDFRIKDPHRDIMVAGRNFMIPDMIKRSHIVFVRQVDDRSLQLIAFFRFQIRIGERFQRRSHEFINCDNASSPF